MNRVGLALIVGLIGVSVLAAQLKVDVALVNVVATITDDKGRYVSDLTADDLIVEEDDRALHPVQ
jgi:D-arabinose 1-dehydrogenase-like Zn-dependent alcohol dehydrogenase